MDSVSLPASLYADGEDDITGQGTSTGGYGNFIGPLSGAIANVAAYDWATTLLPNCFSSVTLN